MTMMWKVYLGNHYTHYSNDAKIFFNLTFHILILLLRTTKFMSCRAIQDGQVLTWSTGDGNGKPFQYFCIENTMNSMKRQKDRTLKDELPRSVGAQHNAGEEWRHSSRKKEKMEPKQKLHPVMDVTGNGTQVRCCKEQYCIRTWNVSFMNQGKLEVVKQKAF